MSNVLNKITKEYLISVNTPDYSVTDWIINPKMPDCDKKHMVIENDTIREMTQIEKNKLSVDEENITTENQVKKDAEQSVIKQAAIDKKNEFMNFSLDEKLEYLYDRGC